MVVNQIAESYAGFGLEQASIVELEKNKLLNQARFLSVIGYHYDILYLVDSRECQRIYEIQLFDKKLKCLYDNSDNCIHVNFASALYEVSKVLPVNKKISSASCFR